MLILIHYFKRLIKLLDKIKIENCLFISKYIHNKLPKIFDKWFLFSSNTHKYETSFAVKGCLKVPSITTTTYGKSAFTSMAIETWNNLQKQLKDSIILKDFPPSYIKSYLTDFFLTLYTDPNNS